jgi:hypothetical protein
MNFEQVSQKLSRSELERAKLLAKLETFQCERNSDAIMAKEEAEKSSILRTRLIEQDEENKKQLLTLYEATQQIRSLELTIQGSCPASNNHELLCQLISQVP